MIKKNSFAPELLPQVNTPSEIQDVRNFDQADKKDMEDWYETAAEVLNVIPEFSSMKLNSERPFESSLLNKQEVQTDKEENNFSLFSNDMMFFSDADQSGKSPNKKDELDSIHGSIGGDESQEITINQEKGKILHLADGSIYEGQLNHNNTIHGFGKLITPSGDICVGTWQYGLMHGICKVMYSSGDIFDGEFKQGK